MTKAKIKSIAYHLPNTILDNEALAQNVDNWTADKIKNKIGIEKRHIAEENETALDLAEMAAKKLFASSACTANQIEYILLCTQSPDHFLPTTACLLQEKLGIPVTAGAIDYNLGCSGFVYGLSLAKGLIETGQVRNVLLITSETYSKYIKKDDMKVRTIFGDAAAATFIEAEDESENDFIGPFVFGTDGEGQKNLIVKTGAHRYPRIENEPLELYMRGSAIFSFTIKSVPKAIDSLLKKYNISMDTIDYFVFHQANQYMLEHLRDKLRIPQNKFCIDMCDYGNTVSSTIPIVLSNMIKKGSFNERRKVMLVGFGVGYSWCATICEIII